MARGGGRGGGRLQKFLPGCVGFSNLPSGVHAKNNKRDP